MKGNQGTVVQFPAGTGARKCPGWLWVTDSLPFIGYMGDLSSGKKQPGHEAHCSPSSGAKVK